jgi:hypothetical protein
MGVTLYDIKVTSNAARTFTKDATAAKASTTAINQNTTALVTNDKSKTKTGRTSKLLNGLVSKLTKVTEKNTKSTLANAVAQRIAAKASRTAGMNFGMLSLRISEGLVPVLAILYTAMLPVAAGLLAIASAAIVATGGVLGLMGVGLYAWSKRFKTTAQGYAGARRPYQTSEEPDFLKELGKGFGKVLDIPEIAKMINEAVVLTQDIFGTTLPEAFKKFMLNVDMGVMRTIMKLFTEWLPDAATGLARWGSALFAEIGEGSLGRLNKFFKYLAQGLQNTAKWLSVAGFSQLDDLTSILGQAISQLMTLGKTVLPILVDVLKSVYPMPLKPIIEGLTSFFDALGNSKAGMATVKALTGMFLVLATLSLTESFIIAIGVMAKALIMLTSVVLGISTGFATLILIAIALGTALLLWATRWQIVKDALVTLGTFIINEFIFIYNVVAKWIGNLKNLFSWMIGSDERVDYTKAYRELTYSDGSSIFDTSSSKAGQVYESRRDVNIEVTFDKDAAEYGFGSFISDKLKGVRGGVSNV